MQKRTFFARYFDMYFHIIFSGENESKREKQEKEMSLKPNRMRRGTDYIRERPN